MRRFLAQHHRPLLAGGWLFALVWLIATFPHRSAFPDTAWRDWLLWAALLAACLVLRALGGCVLGWAGRGVAPRSGRAGGALRQAIENLDAPDKRRTALRNLAEYYGHPFGFVSIWGCDEKQLETLARLYREW